MRNPLDVEIAILFKRFFSYYIRKRVPPKQIINPELEADNKWFSNFSGETDSFEYVLDDNIKITLFKDSILCKVIFDSFEESEICFLKKFLKQGDVFFDIGANIGLFSLNSSPIVGKSGSVFAFEPTPKIFLRLLKNIELNEFKNIKTENIGLSNNQETLKFHVSENGFDAWNSFAPLSFLDNSSEIDVKTNTLDNYISTNNINKIDLIKLDVEGWEYNVLKGAVNLLSMPTAPVLIVEFTESNAFEAGYYCGELFDFVKSFGYNWYLYDKETNSLIPQIKKLYYPYENLIALKDLNYTNRRLNK